MRIDIHLFTQLLPSRRAALEGALRPLAERVPLACHDRSGQCSGSVLCRVEDLEAVSRTLGALPSKLVDCLREELVRATDNLDTVIVKWGDAKDQIEVYVPAATTNYA